MIRHSKSKETMATKKFGRITNSNAHAQNNFSDFNTNM